MIPPDRQPILEGRLVRLRPLVAADRAALYAVAADPLLWQVHPAHDRWQRPVFDAFFDAGLASGGALTVQDAATGAVIGSSRYDDWRPDRDEIEIGWTYLARSHWGGAYNGEMKAPMLAHIHRFVTTATFTIGEDNVRSRRAIERIGGVLREGRVMRTMAAEAKPHVIYAIARTAPSVG